MSPDGVEMTKSFEGCRLEAYQDQAGVWTIAYGRTCNVNPGDTCTQEQADAWLQEDLDNASSYVSNSVDVELTQSQQDALADFVYNLGPGSFKYSTMRSLIQSGQMDRAALEFPKWNKVRINGIYQDSPGLTRRRLAEQAMFFGQDWRAQ